jgi:spore coat protein U-like protein
VRDDASVSIRHQQEKKGNHAMKKTLLCTLLAAAFAAPAIAGDTATLAVSAVVTGTCKFTTGSFTMDFGTLDPVLAPAATQTTALGYKCTKGQAATSFSFDGNSSSPATINIANGANNIPVQLSWTLPAGSGTGFGAGSTALTMNVQGDIAVGSYANSPAGTYSKNVSVVVAP